MEQSDRNAHITRIIAQSHVKQGYFARVPDRQEDIFFCQRIVVNGTSCKDFILMTMADGEMNAYLPTKIEMLEEYISPDSGATERLAPETKRPPPAV